MSNYVLTVRGRRKELANLRISKNAITFLGVTFCGVLLDLITKWIIFKNFKDAGRFEIIPKFLGIICSENEGIVFGFAQGKNNILIFFSIAAIGAILWFYKSFDGTALYSNIAFGMILSGAIGNLWDRIFYHHVRDFIDVHLGMGYHWPTFNIADSLICIGVGLLFCEAFFCKKKIRKG
ncbi:MAG: signal peptidase II [Candidatus Scalindua sediminis]